MWWVVVSLLLRLSNAAIKLSVSSLDVVHEGMLNQPLHANLEVDSISIDAVQAGTLCLSVNGQVCHCFDEEPVGKAKLTWPERCARAVGAAQSSRSAVYHLGARVQLSASSEVVVTSGLPLSLVDPRSGLTLVLALALSDATRAAEVLLPSLARLHSSQQVETAVYEMLVLVPDRDHSAIAALFATRSDSLPFPVVIVPESTLLGFEAFVGQYYSYAIQMSLKLLAARLVSTEYYLTLDADVLLLQPSLLTRLLVPGPRGVYEDEPRAVHRAWWEGSARLLGLPAPLPLHSDTHVPGSGFGVTPAVLSTYGSLVVLGLLRDRFLGAVEVGVEGADESAEWVARWLRSFASEILTPAPATLVWSEYTLYRLGLESVGLFPLLHVPERPSGGPDYDAKTPRLHCFDVWYADQLPWPVDAVRAHVNVKDGGGCVFSVIQSSSGAAVEETAKQFALAVLY